MKPAVTFCPMWAARPTVLARDKAADILRAYRRARMVQRRANGYRLLGRYEYATLIKGAVA